MSATDYFENALLALIFNGTSATAIAENISTSPATEFYISLHTSDPGEAGDQTTNEATFTSYARASVVRSNLGWDVTGNIAKNVGLIQFPKATGGSSVVTHFGIGLSATGAGTLLYKGVLTNSLAVSNGITPAFEAGDLTVVLD